MCGIFGICYDSSAGITPEETKKILNHLFCFSQSRGKEASGLFLKTGDEIQTYKDTIRGNHFIKTPQYKELFNTLERNKNNNTMIIGHARLDTNGSKWDNTNNSPLDYNSISGIHNGIVTNVNELWADNSELERHFVVDSEVLLALFSKNLQQGKDEYEALENIFSKIEGSASVALYNKENNTLSLATNTGSLYFSRYSEGLFVFASEQYILEQLHKKMNFLKRYPSAHMHQIKPKTSLTIDINTIAHKPYEGRLVHAVL